MVEIAVETDVQNNAYSLHGDTKQTKTKPTAEFAVGLVMPEDSSCFPPRCEACPAGSGTVATDR